MAAFNPIASWCDIWRTCKIRKRYSYPLKYSSAASKYGTITLKKVENILQMVFEIWKLQTRMNLFIITKESLFKLLVITIVSIPRATLGNI